jgi:hypothetical protein
MLRKINLLWLAMSILFSNLIAQDPTSWINYSQDYIKLKIVEDGWYRVSGTELQSAGFPVSSVAASQIQLFRRGQEVAISTQTTTGASTLDYFEFWGERNDGALDTDLYILDAQPHEHYSLFTDTATYFLTWSTETNHKRILTNTQNDNTGLTPKTEHLNSSHILQTNNYARGRYFGGTSNDYLLSEYDTGEGWTGSVVSKSAFQDFDFVLTNREESSTNQPQIEVVAIGRNSLEHVVTIWAGPSTASLFNLGQINFEGYTSSKRSFDFDWSMVGAGGDLVVRCEVTGVAGATDNVSFSSVKVNYPQQINLIVGANKGLTFVADGTSRFYIHATSADPASFSFYDVTDPYTVLRLPQNAFSTRSDIVFPFDTPTKELAVVSTPLTVPVIKSYQFDRIVLTNQDYLIITHPLLRDYENGPDPVAAYENYRESIAGGGYKVVVAEIDDVYDQFHYGEPSVMAIRNLFDMAYTSGIQYALILGKGRTPDYNIFRRTYGNPDELSSSEVIVPTYGSPGGDFPFSIGLDGTRPLIPAIATGRVNVWKAEQLADYLDKVIAMESVPFDALWRKELIHLSGGTSDLELNTFSNYIRDFKVVAEGDYLGGKAYNNGKKTSVVSEQFDISTEVNRGVGFITLFGHSSSTVTDVEIGKPSNPDFNYQNEGKYPLILVNGCRAGEIFGNTVSFGEDWVSYPKKGAIGFIAHADQASSANLKRYSDMLYEVAFEDTTMFGISIGEVMREAADRYYDFGSSESLQTQIQQTLYQGDPAIAYFEPRYPDYHLLEDQISAVSISGSQLLSQQDSFLVRLPIHNYGRTSLDSLPINITRNFPDGNTKVYEYLLYPPRYSDSLEVYLFNPAEYNVEGTNTLLIQLDPQNQLAELDETNNNAVLDVFISSGSTQHLIPYDQAIVGGDEVHLYWQLTNPFELIREVSLEVDTTLGFGSPYMILQSIVGENLMDYSLDISTIPDSTVVYWRTRFATPDTDEDTIWSVSSFTKVMGMNGGWGQFSLDQFARNELVALDLNENQLGVSFEVSTVPITLTTTGTDFYQYDNLEIYVNETNLLATINTIDPVCRSNTFNALVFDRNTASLKRPITPSNIDVYDALICGRLPQMIYNLTSDEMLANRRIEELITNLEIGDQIAFFNIDSVAYSTFDAAIIAALGEIGVDPSQLIGLVDGQPLVIFGVKGMNPGEALMITNDGSALPPTQQTIRFNQDVIGIADFGSLNTPLIGPASSWSHINLNLGLTGNDFANIEVVGLSKDGQEGDLIKNTDALDSMDLSFVDASEYPYLYLTIEFGDPDDLTPPTLGGLSVSYTGAPEGILIPGIKSTIELQEGQDLNSSYSFINVGNSDYTDSLEVNFTLRNVNQNNSMLTNLKLAPLVVGDTAEIPYTFNTVNLGGQNSLIVKVTSTQEERIDINNQLITSEFARISEETINPLIDVTIDGRYILDGEIVSSTPMIRVAFQDENQYLTKVDTTGLELFLKYPGLESPFQRINYSQPEVTWSPATDEEPFEVSYQPALAEDGQYTMRVAAEDESGNKAGEEPYEISFEVVNEATITHFYPYPNPFSSSCRFVFTVTGAQVPDQILIQIMTISGRVVKNIDETELGLIRIGNNISEYAWDGRDDFGDLLANGVYLYRVTVKSNGETLEHRATAADQAFKRNIGKLYILR